MSADASQPPAFGAPCKLNEIGGGRTSLPDAFLNDPTVSAGAKALAGILRSMAWSGKDSAWPRQDTLAERLGVRSVRTVQRYLAELRRYGVDWFQPNGRRKGRKSGFRPNVYTGLRLAPRRPKTPPAAGAPYDSRVVRLPARSAPSGLPYDIGVARVVKQPVGLTPQGRQPSRAEAERQAPAPAPSSSAVDAPPTGGMAWTPAGSGGMLAALKAAGVATTPEERARRDLAQRKQRDAQAAQRGAERQQRVWGQQERLEDMEHEEMGRQSRSAPPP